MTLTPLLPQSQTNRSPTYGLYTSGSTARPKRLLWHPALMLGKVKKNETVQLFHTVN